ncbi:MAG: hypothetical protein F4Z58_09420 [Acidimicrobiaceae bacterium]|nr:hypothetical protein [Acidimicrobiaceae bacterium]MXW76240.1 hypothetical protein [Acidimicrobiaceae bacterium]MYC41018.1 hypothetical protein [Acidimicrobiaceae bacterium]MYD07024.1 hypothetical protein [Acidimicrobiaceae bacterium]MYI58165.1 hypothetical protein [Acidimicrobiaceae bacterium]
MYINFSHVWFADSAFRHGVAKADALHACRNAIRIFRQDDLLMYVGADQSGRMLEVGVSTRGESSRVVHAMPARSNFLR